MKTKEEILAKWRQPLKEETGHDIEKICLLEAMEEYAQAYHEDKARWISVEERLPEKNGYYIAWCIAPNEPGLINYHPSTGWQNGFYNDRVTHWQEVTPPKINAE